MTVQQEVLTKKIKAQGVASQVSGGVQKLAGLASLSIDPTLGGNNSTPGARAAMRKPVTGYQ